MNQYDGGITEAIMAAAASKQGCRSWLMPQYSPIQIGRIVQKLRDRGDLFTATISHRKRVHFTTKEAADAFQRSLVKVTIRERVVPSSAWSNQDVVIDRRKVKECPAPHLHSRFEPSGDIPSVISSQACRPWAIAATGGGV